MNTFFSYGLAIFTTLIFSNCNKTKEAVLIKATESDLTLQVDTVVIPGALRFPFILRLTNAAEHAALLAFEPDTAGFKFQVKNMYLVADKDTFFICVGDPGMYFRACLNIS